MRVGILARPDSWYFRDLQRAAADVANCRSVVSLSFSSLAAALEPGSRIATRELPDLGELDAVLVRTMPPGSLEQVVFRMNALHRLAATGTRVINSPRCLEIAVDKYLALAQLQAAGLPVPRTRTSQDWEQAMIDYQQLGGDVVVKPIFGSEGRGLVRVTDEDHAWRIFKSLTQLGHVICQQEFIDHQGEDHRVLILGRHVFGIRRVNRKDWRTNISRGAIAHPLDVDDQQRAMAETALKVTGAQMLAVDILTATNGQNYLLEVNAVPGWRALARTLETDIAKKVVALAVA